MAKRITDRPVALPVERIQQRILVIRGQRIILDSDLAQAYGVTTARLNQQVKRNQNRFPEDFLFELTKEEYDNLMLQFATSNSGWGGRRKLPTAFTEHGAVMAASVLNSDQAVKVSVFVVRAFVQLRLLLGRHVELAAKIKELEERVGFHDKQIGAALQAIRLLMEPVDPPASPRKPIGFATEQE